MGELLMKLIFSQFDPRPQGAEANDKIFASGPVLGIEVTVPALAARCTLGNIDPQHTQGRNYAAIEDVLGVVLPPDGATLATVRADLDSVGAMAVLAMRAEMGQEEFDSLPMEVVLRLQQVATADKFARGGYPGPKALPTMDNPWPEESASAESSRPLAAIAAAVVDFKVSLAERVETMKKWLLTGEETAQYRAVVERERTDMVRALGDGTIRAKRVECAIGAVALVESTHRAATVVGYSLAPVVVALNPSFKLGAGEPHRKFTICAYTAQNADIKSALAELAKLEPGWGGSPTIGGSPQGVSSTLTVEQVVEVVARHLK